MGAAYYPPLMYYCTISYGGGSDSNLRVQFTLQEGRRPRRDVVARQEGLPDGMPRRSFGTAFGGFQNGRTRKFARGAGGRGFRRTSGALRLPGRFAGRYRRSGFYGRYNKSPGVELKFHDISTGLDVNPVPTAGAFVQTSWNLIPQDVTEDGRIGRKCTIHSVMLRGAVRYNEVDAAATPPPADLVRILVYLDTQCNGAVANATALLVNDAITSPNNLSDSGRFKTLWDKFVVMNFNGLASDGAGVVSAGENMRYFSMYKKVKIPLQFSGATGAIAEIRSNNIGCMVISAQAGCQITNSIIRLRFEG